MSTEPSNPSPATRGANQWLVLGVLVAPAILTFVRVASNRHPNDDGLTLLIALPGSVVAGVVCAVFNARSRQASTGGKVLLILVGSVLLSVLSLSLCFVGCALGLK